jgi:hypothetical protein
VISGLYEYQDNLISTAETILRIQAITPVVFSFPETIEFFSGY